VRTGLGSQGARRWIGGRLPGRCGLGRRIGSPDAFSIRRLSTRRFGAEQASQRRIQRLLHHDAILVGGDHPRQFGNPSALRPEVEGPHVYQ
jgi:hypothetical protein